MANKNFKIEQLFLLLLFFSFYSIQVYSQPLSDELDVTSASKQADEEFANKNYLTALDLYKELNKNEPENLKYSERLGICLFYTQEDKALSIPYLKFVCKNYNPSIIREDVYLYLGKAYMLNYQFDEAIEQFKIYYTLAPSSDIKKNNPAHLIEMCLNAKTIRQDEGEWEIVKKVLVPEEEVLKNYEEIIMSGEIKMKSKKNMMNGDKKDGVGISGNTGLKPEMDFFNTELDYLANDNDPTTVYTSRDLNTIIVSSYGTVEGYGKDIYVITKQSTDKWSEAKLFPGDINTKYDENFPFLSPDGKTFYFCSKGHNSMGGYDIFKTTFDEANNAWSTPKNLGPPFNSPADDILFAIDNIGTTIFFASTRNSPLGKFTIFKLIKKRKTASNGFTNSNQSSSGGSGSNGAQQNGQQQSSSGSSGANAAQQNTQQQSSSGNLGTTSNHSSNKPQEPLQMVPVKGVVKNPTDKHAITVIDLKANRIIGTFKPNMKNGEYVMNLAKGRKYLFQIKSDKPKTDEKILEIPMDFNGDTLRQEITSDADGASLQSEHLVKTLPELKDLYYSVQIGSFSKYVSDTTIFLDIKPFYYKTHTDKTIKYFIGVYNNLEYALLAKAKVKELGINQCFIVPYYGAERISIEKAKEYEKENKHSKSNFSDMNVLPYTSDRLGY